MQILTPQDAAILLNLVTLRKEVLKKRVLKENKEDWSDYDESQIEYKIKCRNSEYQRLNYIEEDLFVEQKKLQDKTFQKQSNQY